MADLQLKHIYKRYAGGVTAVSDFTLDIDDKEFIILVGPSGCGKSTTLRMVAGLEEISEGELYIGGRLVNDVAPKDRDIAMVFQNYALYPHMTVFENMAFGLKLRKLQRTKSRSVLQKLQRFLTLSIFLTESRRLFQAVRDSVLLWDVQSYVILKYSLWTSLCHTWMQS